MGNFILNASPIVSLFRPTGMNPLHHLCNNQWYADLFGFDLRLQKSRRFVCRLTGAPQSHRRFHIVGISPVSKGPKSWQPHCPVHKPRHQKQLHIYTIG